MSDRVLLTEREAAALLGLSVVFLQKDRVRGQAGIPFVKAGKRSVRYRRCDLETWAAERVRTTAPRGKAAPAAPVAQALPPRRRGRPTKSEQMARAAAAQGGDHET